MPFSFNDFPWMLHLKELRFRLIIYGCTLLVFFSVCYAFSGDLIAILMRPITHAFPKGTDMVFTALPEGFITHLKVSFWFALWCSLPVALYQIWRFISPGLYLREKRAILKILFWALFCFGIGVCVTYLFVIPRLLTLASRIAHYGIEPLPRLQSYFLFVMESLLMVSLLFELPLVLYLSVHFGLFDVNVLRRNRKIGYILMYVLVVFILPDDIFSQFLLMLPMILSYEAGISMSCILKRKKT
jgi:sec-independent protein translocase protein TatC